MIAKEWENSKIIEKSMIVEKKEEQNVCKDILSRGYYISGHILE